MHKWGGLVCSVHFTSLFTSSLHRLTEECSVPFLHKHEKPNDMQNLKSAEHNQEWASLFVSVFPRASAGVTIAFINQTLGLNSN